MSKNIWKFNTVKVPNINQPCCYNFPMLHRIFRTLDFLSITIVMIVAATGDSPRFSGQTDQVRSFTREIEFDYPNWVWDATWVKLEQNAIGFPYLFDRGTNHQIVFEYLRATEQLMQVEYQIEQVFSDPVIKNKEGASIHLRRQRDKLLERQETLSPLAEAVFQSQITEVLAELGITTLGQPIPPVLYHTSPTPLALIVSRREVIEQVANI